MTAAEIVDLAKRQAHHGAAGNNADQPALDLLKCLNNTLYRIWRARDWDWSLDDISITPSTSDGTATLAATSGEITELYVDGQEGDIRRYTRREYLRWQRSDPDESGNIIGYIHRGRDASKNIKLTFFPTPATTTTVKGWAKKRLTTLTTADWSTEIAYFPVEMHDVIQQFITAEAYRLANDDRAAGEREAAQRELKMLASQENSQADLDPKAPVPDYLRLANRRRGKGTGVY